MTSDAVDSTPLMLGNACSMTDSANGNGFRRVRRRPGAPAHLVAALSSSRSALCGFVPDVEWLTAAEDNGGEACEACIKRATLVAKPT